MSLDGAVDIARQGHPHGDEPVHQIDADRTTTKPVSSVTDPVSDGEHSEHCCHGHVDSIVMRPGAAVAIADTSFQPALQVAHVANGAQAPPTPPPNA